MVMVVKIARVLHAAFFCIFVFNGKKLIKVLPKYQIKKAIKHAKGINQCK